MGYKELLEINEQHRQLNGKLRRELQETSTDLDELFKACKDKIRYGNLWSDFTLEELVEYSRIKAKRGKLLYEGGVRQRAKGRDRQPINAIDDLLDAANLAIMAAKKIQELEENGTFIN